MYVCVCKIEVNSIRVPSKIGNAPATAPIFSSGQLHSVTRTGRTGGIGGNRYIP